MMQAIGTLGRAVDQLEQDMARLAAMTPPSSPGIDMPGARAALRSLDDLIADLKDRTIG